MKNLFALTIILALLITGCTEIDQNTEESIANMTDTIIEMASPTFTQTSTITPIPTPTPTLDPASTLKGTLYYWSSNNIGMGINSYNVKNGVETILVEDSWPHCYFSVSPDGRYIVYPVYPSGEIGANELYLFDVQNDETINITNKPDYYREEFSMSNNNLIVFSSSEYGQTDIFLYDIEQSSLEKLTNNDKAKLSVTISPDGNFIAYITSNAPYTRDLEILEVATKQIIDSIPISQTINTLFNLSFSPDNHWIAYFEEVDSEKTIFHIISLENYKDISLDKELGLITHMDIDIDSYDWSPESDSIVFNTFDYDEYVSNIYLFDLQLEEFLLLYTSTAYASNPRWFFDGSWIMISDGTWDTSKIIAIDPYGEYDPITILESNESICNLAWVQ